MSILADFVLRHAGSPENATSDAMQTILTRSRGAMDGLVAFLGTLGITDLATPRIRREVASDAGDRADFVITDESGAERVVIEAKYLAGLTENQPTAYLSRLDSPRPSALIFVCPPSRVASLWGDINHKLVGEEPLTPDPSVPTGLGGRTSRGVGLFVVAWPQLLGFLSSAAERHGDLAAHADIVQVLGVTERFARADFMPIFPEALGPQTARSSLSYFALVDDLIATLANEGVALRASTRFRSATTKYYGADVAIEGVTFWVGLWWEAWADSADTPFWMHAYEPIGVRSQGVRALDSVAVRLGLALRDSPDGASLPLFPRTGASRPDTLESLVAEVRMVRDALRAGISPE